MSTRLRSFWRALQLAMVCAAALLAMGVCTATHTAVAASAIATAPTATATSGVPQFSLRPVVFDPSNPATAAYFIFAPQPGATIHSQVRVTNTGNAAGSVALYAVDATTGQTSGTVYLARQAPRADVGAWVNVGTAQLTLNSGQSQVVAFTVKVPQQVRPGQHVGGIVAENLTVQQGSSNSAVQINVQHLSIIAVQLNLPGQQTQQLRAQSVSAGGEHGYQMLFVALRNTGTQMLKPFGTLQINDVHGNQLKTMRLALDTFLPQTAISYPVLVSGQALGAGRYTAILTLTYGDNHVLNFTTSFTITAANVQQVFGGSAPTTPPPAVTSNGANGAPSIPALVGGATLGLLVLAVGMVFAVPGLRVRLLTRRR